MLAIHYANGSAANQPADIAVNGLVAASALAFNGTGAWTTWVTVTLTVAVNAANQYGAAESHRHRP